VKLKTKKIILNLLACIALCPAIFSALVWGALLLDREYFGDQTLETHLFYGFIIFVSLVLASIFYWKAIKYKSLGKSQ